MMKVVFWGSPDFAIPSLAALLEAGYPVLGVVTQPDKKQGRKQKLTPSLLKEFAQSKGIPVFQPETPNTSEFVGTLQGLQADAMAVVAYGKIFSQKVLKTAPLGFFNVHFSLLPAYRGASPVSSAILAGEKETGITIIKLVKQMDAGPMFARLPFPIGEHDTTGDLLEKLGQLGAKLLVETFHGIESGTSTETLQDESQATFCKMVEKKDGLVDWHQPALFLQRFIRAMTPWPTAYTFLQKNNERVIFFRSSVMDIASQAEPGTILNAGKEGIDVAAQGGCLRIQMLQRSGKAVLKAEEFLRGMPLAAGDRFGNEVVNQGGSPS